MVDPNDPKSIIAKARWAWYKMCIEDLRLLVRYIFLSVCTPMRFVPSNLNTSVTSCTYNCSCIKVCIHA